MTAEPIIEGEVREERALVPVPVKQTGLARSTEPEEVVTLATRMANALKDIVDQKHLYADIRGKRFPTVEAWMTVARFDNVVGREVSVTRQPDGSYEAWSEIIRLADGASIGRASAICGMEDDKPWCDRPEYARRSMAVTRSMSRAFRMQYSWIMSLAGYEPGVAEEQPRDDDEGHGSRRRTRQQAVTPLTITGSVEPEAGDGEPREYPQGWAVLFHVRAQGTDELTRVIVTRDKREELPTLAAGDRVRIEGEWQPRQNALVTHEVKLAVDASAESAAPALDDAFSVE